VLGFGEGRELGDGIFLRSVEVLGEGRELGFVLIEEAVDDELRPRDVGVLELLVEALRFLRK